MTTKVTSSWKRSTQARKQRKYRYNAPLHERQKLLHVHLSEDLQKKYQRRAVLVRVGDKVRILRGAFKKRDAKVERIALRKERVFISGMEYIRKDGTKVPMSFHPSVLMITELLLDDTQRRKKLMALKRADKETQ